MLGSPMSELQAVFAEQGIQRVPPCILSAAQPIHGKA